MRRTFSRCAAVFTGLAAFALVTAARAATYTATPSTTEGPYYTMSSANNADKSHFTGEGIDNDLTHIYATSTQCNGTVMLLSGQLTNTAGTAISGATIELWEADNGGIYWYTSSSSGTNAYANRDRNFQGYGTCTTDSSGNWSFRTIRPGLYVGRIRHFHFKVRINGTQYLTSQFMFSEDSASFSSDNVAASLVSAGTMSLVTITPTSGTDSSGNSVLVASKNIVITYAVSGTAPSITTQPSSLTVTAGSSATFSVIATGTATLSYQWYKGSVAISGATSSTYTISSTTAASAGSYTVVVSNSVGSATSSAATLTVETAVSAAPTIAASPAPAAIATGDSVTLSVTASGAGTISYQWYQDGVAIAGATSSSYTISSATSTNAGSYYVVVLNEAGSTTSSSASVLVTTPASGTDAAMINLSARAYLPSADTVLIAGFVIEASTGKRVLVRAVGPTLADFNITNPLADPRLEIYGDDASLLTSNDNWDASLTSTFDETGAFALPAGSKDAATVVTLPTGKATAHVRGTSAGVALVETFDADGATAANRLVNLSARAQVGTGDSVLIAGFVIEGTGGKQLLIRGIGPALAGFNVSSPLSDPKLEIYDSASELVATNDNWDASLATVFNALSAFALTTGSKDAALLVTLPANASYTAIVRGVGDVTGEALVELYEVP